MGHIKAPKGIDFVSHCSPLTKAEEIAISDYIKNYKLKNNNLFIKSKPTTRKRKIQFA